MNITDEPELQIRAKNRARIAYSIRNHIGNLELTLSERETKLSGNNEIFYMANLINGNWSKKDRFEIIEDITLACKREGYSQSLLSKIALKPGYIPSKISFQKN